MKHRTIVAGSFLLTLLIWLVFSWPLPRYINDGIPATYKAEQIPFRDMMPGDHLQLMYHFWLLQDFVSGDTPWFHNLYEFNEGDDAERYEPGTYFFPFSGVYAILAAIGGRSFGWNLTGLFSLWMTVYLTWLYLRRWGDQHFTTLLLAGLTIMFPYRWVTLFGGSPTGFAMAVVPLLFLGMDIAIRDRKISGGILAGLAIFFACWTDTHVFFFVTVASPLVALLSLIRDDTFRIKDKTCYIAYFKALIPVPILLAAAFWINTTISSGIAEAGHKARTPEETIPFTPAASGLWTSDCYIAPDNHVYFGWMMFGTLVALAVIVIAARIRKGSDLNRHLILIGILGASILLVILSALGPKEPLLDGRLWNWTRKLIPPYQMVRQTDKVFCLLPTLLALALLIGLQAAQKLIPLKRTLWPLLTALLIGAIAVDYNAQTSPAISGIRETHPVYAAVADDAKENKTEPRAIILTIWPGESHYGSIYMHYCSLYNIRMINGYTPFPSKRYIDDVFHFYEPMNMGYVTDEHLDRLLEVGIEYVLVHENLFEEKVSAFPVAHTLHRLMNHPRLDILEVGEGVWGFKIRAEAQSKETLKPEWNTFFAARRWETEGLERFGVVMTTNTTVGGAGYLTMADPDAWIKTHATGLAETPDLSWWVRVRGQGSIAAGMTAGDSAIPLGIHEFNTEDWHWLKIPASGIPRYDNWRIHLRQTNGAPEVDLIILMAGSWKQPAIGESVSIPPALFFHGGSTSLENNHITLEPENEIEAIRLYGPKLPLDPGNYVVTMKYDVPDGTPPDTLVGEIDVRWIDHIANELRPVYAAEFGTYEFTQTSNLPINFCFVYKRTTPMTITGIQIRRIR